MINSIKASIVLLGISILFSGCIGNRVPVSIYKPVKKPTVLQGTQKVLVTNGALKLNNGNKIYDSEGNIYGAYVINKKVYYLVKITNKKLYKLKDVDENTIKEFEATDVKTYLHDNNVIFMVQEVKPKIKRNLYDNVYEFNGNDFKLINKNVYVNGDFDSGIYMVNVSYASSHENYYITDITNSKTVKFKASSDEYIRTMYFVGAINNNICYVKGSTLTETAQLKVLNTTTGKRYTLAQADTKIQLLKSGNQVVLKIFENIGKSNAPKIKEKYISLNSIEEVEGISSNFTPIKIVVFGGDWKELYTVRELGSNMYKKSGRKNIQPIF